MARIRTGSHVAPVDQEILGHVAAAERSIRQALDACLRAKRKTRSPGSNLRMGRVLRTRRDLLRVMAALSNVHRVVSLYDMGGPEDLDPDLMTAEDREAFAAAQAQKQEILAAVAERLSAEMESAE